MSKLNLKKSKELFSKDVEFLARAVESRDKLTGNHVGRVTAYTLFIASKLGWDQKLEQAYLGSILHDIGKIGIPDAILNNCY